jgi:AraC family transcriptional regulator, regulatory protein of adaptative response / DNA-3-methyladenine glycosylase II
VVQRALRLIQDGALDYGSVSDLANRLGIGVRHLSRLFAQHVGASAATVAQTRRLHFAKRLLDDTQLPITDIALASGFGSVRRFNDAFLATYRRSPRELRKGRRGGTETGADAEVTLRLAYRPPYDWEHVCGCLAKVAIPGVEVVTAGCFARAVRTPGGYALLQIRPVPRQDALEVRVQRAMPAELPNLLSSVRRMFDLAADPAHIKSTLQTDPLLRRAVALRPGLRIPGAWDPFECSVSALLSRKAAFSPQVDVLKRLVERFGKPIEPLVSGVDYLFPSPAILAGAELDTLKIVGERREALRQLTREVCKEVLRFDAPSEQVSRKLCALPGLGPWAAGYVSLRGLGEPDALPFGDRRVRLLASTGGKPLTSLALEARAESWRPFRGYAVIHLWATEQS